MLSCAAPYIQRELARPLESPAVERNYRCMTSSQGMELATLILEDPTKAIPLLQILDAFKKSHGDPLGETFIDDVMHHVYTRTGHCHESMMEFLSDKPKGEPNPVPRAA